MAVAPRRRSSGLLATIALALMASSTVSRAEDLWTVRSGQANFHFNVDLLRDLGIDLEVSPSATVRQEDLVLQEPYWTFAILPGANLEFRTEHGVVLTRGSTDGAIRLAGELVLRDRATGRETRFGDLEIAHPTSDGSVSPQTRLLHLRSAGTKLVFCDLRHSMFNFGHPPNLDIHYLNARLSESWASAIGRPELAGWVVGIGEVRALTERLSSTPPSTPAPQRALTAAEGFLDVKLGVLASIQQVAHSGTFPNGTAALSMSTTSCNVGEVDVPWLAAMQEDHPLIHMAIYRLLNGRLEQIGISWMKHGFFALSDPDCSPCQHPSPDGKFLGVGCSDTYDVGNNSTQGQLGPRSEVNAYARTWECTGSHFAAGQPDCTRRHTSGHGPLDHRLVARDADLANPGATYFYEAYYVVRGDQNLANNWGYRRCTMSWNGSVWNFSTPSTNNPLIQSPALAGWGDYHNYFEVADGDGQALLAVKVTDLGGGSWRYEYGLLNLTSDRQLRSFRLPVPLTAIISNIAFHDNDANAANDWQVSVDLGAITWQTETYQQNPGAHSLEFGSMYNFRFDANAPPLSVNAELGIFKPGLASTVTAPATAPVNAVAAVGDPGQPAARVIEARPHPFQRSVTISYETASGPVDLSVYDAAGRLVRNLVDEHQLSGRRSATWNGVSDAGERVRPGVYYARLRSGAATAVKSLVLID